jgi:hypothetical protein
MSKWMIAVLLCLTPALSAQAPDKRETRTVELKYITSRDLGNLLGAFMDLRVTSDRSERLIVLNGSTESVAAAQALIAKLDVAPKTVDFTFHILAASAKPEAGSDKLPAEVESVVKQLRSNLTYQNYRLLDTVTIRGREGREFSARGVLPNNASYQLNSRDLQVKTGEKGTHILSDRFDFSLTALDPVASNYGNKEPRYSSAQISAPLDVREGQKVVLGKANFANIDGAFFVVVIARLVE